jgi:hypothetical protein
MPLLKQLRQPDLATHKRPTDFHFYMTHDDFKHKVAAVYNKKHADTPKKQQLAVKCQIARELLAAEPDDVKQKLAEELEAAHQESLEAHAGAMEGLPSSAEEDREM